MVAAARSVGCSGTAAEVIGGADGVAATETPGEAGTLTGAGDGVGGFTTRGDAAAVAGFASTGGATGGLATTGPVGALAAIAGTCGGGGIITAGACRGCGTILRGAGLAASAGTGRRRESAGRLFGRSRRDYGSSRSGWFYRNRLGRSWTACSKRFFFFALLNGLQDIAGL